MGRSEGWREGPFLCPSAISYLNSSSLCAGLLLPGVQLPAGSVTDPEEQRRQHSRIEETQEEVSVSEAALVDRGASPGSTARALLDVSVTAVLPSLSSGSAGSGGWDRSLPTWLLSCPSSGAPGFSGRQDTAPFCPQAPGGRCKWSETAEQAVVLGRESCAGRLILLGPRGSSCRACGFGRDGHCPASPN